MEIQDGFFHEGGGSLEFHIRILKTDFKKIFRIIPWLWKRVLHLVWAFYYVYIVVELTMNAAGAAEEYQYLNQLQGDLKVMRGGGSDA